MKKRLTCLVWFLVAAIGAKAQEGGFLYIEAEPSQPFYLRTSDSLILSSPGNYLILAPLRNWTGDIVVGFQGQPLPVFQFTLRDTLPEKGYLLRNTNGEGWRLFDMQKKEMVNIRRLGRDEQQWAQMRRRDDAFATRLSQVVNDSSILYYQPKKAVAVGNPVQSPKTVLVEENKPVVAENKPVVVQHQQTLPEATTVARDTVATDTAKQPVIVVNKTNTDSVKVAHAPLYRPVPAAEEKAPLPENDTVSTKKKADVPVAKPAEKKSGILGGVFGKKPSAPATENKPENTGVRRLFKTDMGSSWKLIYEVDDLGRKDTIEVNIIKEPVTPNRKRP